MPKTVYADGTIQGIKAAVADIDASDPNKEGTIIVNEGKYQWIIGNDNLGVTIHGGINLVTTGYPLDAGTNRNSKNWATEIEVIAEAHNGDWRNVDQNTYQGQAIWEAIAQGYGAALLSFTGYTNGPYKKPIRCSGFKFKGYIADIENDMAGIGIQAIPDFRVDHCRFEDFSGTAFSAGPNGIGWGSRGVFDHNEITNPYKDTFGTGNVKTAAWDAGPAWESRNTGIPNAQAQPACLRTWTGSFHGPDKQWAYGMIIGNAYYWYYGIKNFAGKYYNLPTSINDPTIPAQTGVEPVMVYIEDCLLTKCRHMTAGSAGGGCYVIRHSIVEDNVLDWYSSMVDAHAGTLLTEVYDNEITGFPSDARCETNPDGTLDSRYIGAKLTTAVGIRGGGAIVTRNKISGCNQGMFVRSDSPGTGNNNGVYAARECYIWDNVWSNNNIDLNKSNTDPNQPIFGRDFFDRAPNLAQDGWEYVSFPYPHPLTLDTQGAIVVDSTIPNAHFTIAKV